MHGCLISIPLHQGITEQVGRRSSKYVRSLDDSHCPAGPFTDISFIGLSCAWIQSFNEVAAHLETLYK